MRRRIAFVSLGFCLLLALAFARAPFRRIPSSLFVSDGFGYYIYLPSVVIDGDLDLSNQLKRQPEQPDQKWYEFVETTQRQGNCFQVGCAVLWAPFFLAAHGACLLLHAGGRDVPLDGFGWAYELPVYCGSFLYGMLGLYFCWRLIRDLWGERIADSATFYIAVGTALAAYLWLEPDMSHAPSMALISALFYVLFRIHADQSLDWGRWALVGLLLGLIAAVRATDSLVVLAALLVGIQCAWKTEANWRNVVTCVTACTGCALLAFWPQMLAWKALYGGFLTRPPGVYNEIHWLAPDLVGFFFGAKRGLFVWTPLLLFAALGAVVGWLRGPRFVRYAFLVLAMALYFNMSLPNWWVGCSFSERRTVDYSVLFALGLGALFARFPALSGSRWGHGLGLALCGFNWLLMLRYFTQRLPEYGEVSWYDLYVGTILFPFEIASRFLG